MSSVSGRVSSSSPGSGSEHSGEEGSSRSGSGVGGQLVVKGGSQRR